MPNLQLVSVPSRMMMCMGLWDNTIFWKDSDVTALKTDANLQFEICQDITEVGLCYIVPFWFPSWINWNYFLESKLLANSDFTEVDVLIN